MSILLAAAPRSRFAGIGLSSLLLFPSLAYHKSSQRPLLCEGRFQDSLSSSRGGIAQSLGDYENEAKVPIFKNGALNRKAVGQLSTGSFLGVLGGLAISSFSKSLGALIGLSIFLIQWLQSKGYSVVPTGRIQRYVKGINIRSALEDNIAFKMSFGLTFALASFASL